MPIDPLTILASLAYTALKRLGHTSTEHGLSESSEGGILVLLEDIALHIAGGSAHHDAEKLRDRLGEWFQGDRPQKNLDLERAVSRSALHADLFCLMEALDEPLERPEGAAAGWKTCVWDRCPDSLKTRRFQGFFNQVDRSQIRQARAGCEHRLKELEDHFQPVPFDLDLFRVSMADGDYGAVLAERALQGIEAVHGRLPDRVRAIFAERWFYYLTASFHHEIKHSTPVFRIFVTELIRDEAQKTREHFDKVAEKLLHTGPAKRADPYETVKPLPLNYIERPDLLIPLRDMVLGDSHTVGLTALHGMGGIGKTELARALCHDPQVRAAFPDGIVWIEIGRQSGQNLLERMKLVAEALNEDSSGYTSNNCEAHYRGLLAAKAVLVVLDDVWIEVDVKSFQTDSRRSRVLFTTRDVRIAAHVGAQDFTARFLTQEQAREVLGRCSRRLSSEMPAAADEIIRECGFLPLGLSEIGSMLRSKPDRTWRSKLEALRQAKIASVHAPTKVSVDALDELLRGRYLDLAVLPEDKVVPIEILRVLWHTSEHEAGDIADEIVDRSLAEREDDGIRLHDLQLDYVRSQYGDRSTLSQINAAIRLSWHVVRRDPQQFVSQLVGRLFCYKLRVGISDFLNSIIAGTKRPWLKPLNAALTARGEATIQIFAGHTREIWGVAISADGRRALSGSYDGTLRVWDIDSGRELFTLAGHTHGLIGAVSMDWPRAVSLGGDELKVWDLDRGRELNTFSDQGEFILCLAVNAHGNRAVSGSLSGVVGVWDLESGREVHTLTGHTAGVNGVAITADGQRAVSASADQTLKIWDLDKGSELHTLRGHTDSVNGVALTADGQCAVSASSDRSVKIWDMENANQIDTLIGHTGSVRLVAINSDGQRAISASDDQTLKVWDLDQARQLSTSPCRFGPLAISANAPRAISALGNTLIISDFSIGEEFQNNRAHSGPICGLAVTADARLVISASSDKTLKIWDVETTRELHVLEGHSDVVLAVAISADGGRAVSGSADKTLKIWDLRENRELYCFGGHRSWITGVALSADGKRAVSTSFDRTMRGWDLETGRELYVFERDYLSQDVALSADGRRAISSSSNNALQVWDVKTQNALLTLPGHRDLVWGLAMSADGQLAASASWDETIKVWDLEIGREICTLVGHTDRVSGVAVSRNGQTAVSASYDHTVKVWDVKTRSCIATFTCDAPAFRCAFAGDKIVAGDQGGNIHFLAIEV